MIERIREFITIFYTNLMDVQQARIINTLIVIGLLVLFRFIALRLIHRRFAKNTRALYNSRKSIEYGSIIVGVIIIGRIWLFGVQSLLTYLGLVSAGIAIALQDPIVDLAGWLFIVSRRPFVMGDRIQIGELLGDVVDIRIFQFSMLEIGGGRINAEQSTGRIIHVPNGEVFKKAVINTHQGLPYIWNEIDVMITFESDWRRAKSLLMEIVEQLAPDVSQAAQQYLRQVDKRFVINYGNVKPTVYTRVGESGVIFSLRYMVDPRRRRGSEQTIWEAILASFDKHNDIDFAYPTRREYFHFQEGKHRRDLAGDDAPTMVGRPTDWARQPQQKKPDIE